LAAEAASREQQLANNQQAAASNQQPVETKDDAGTSQHKDGNPDSSRQSEMMTAVVSKFGQVKRTANPLACPQAK